MSLEPSVTERFEANRQRLRAVAYRLLGSMSEADDAVQEAWLRLNRADTEAVDNLDGWLTTVVSRVCLDMLRSRKSRREDSITTHAAEPGVVSRSADPESEAILADAVGVALLIVLDRLAPAERLAFVLHDLFALPFDEIGPIIGRSANAAKQLASRARRRVRGSAASPDACRDRQREVVDAFLRAARSGDLQGLLAVLDPDAVMRIDAAARVDGVVRRDAPEAEAGMAREIRGASVWAPQMLALSRGVKLVAQPAMIDGSIGVVVGSGGKMVRALLFTFANDRIVRLDAVGDPARLRELDIAVL